MPAMRAKSASVRTLILWSGPFGFALGPGNAAFRLAEKMLLLQGRERGSHIPEIPIVMQQD